jgi:hypothetical protein
MRLFRRSPDPLLLAKRHITGSFRVSAAALPGLHIGIVDGVACQESYGETFDSCSAYTIATELLDGLDGVWPLLEIESFCPLAKYYAVFTLCSSFSFIAR